MVEVVVDDFKVVIVELEMRTGPGARMETGFNISVGVVQAVTISDAVVYLVVDGVAVMDSVNVGNVGSTYAQADSVGGDTMGINMGVDVRYSGNEASGDSFSTLNMDDGRFIVSFGD